LLAHTASSGRAVGATLLIYHRVGGGSPDERDVPTDEFRRQLDALQGYHVVALDEALDLLDDERSDPSVVLTFDDGFRDVYENAWPLLEDRGLPFTLYLSTAYVGGTMTWDGSTAKAAGPALTWEEIADMTSSGLCTVGNHTHTHARPEVLDEAELDRCSAEIRGALGVEARHFAFTWGVSVPRLKPALRTRFRSAATGELGRNIPGQDMMSLRRVPVRASDPLSFFRAKLHGRLVPERSYRTMVTLAKKVGARA